MRTWRTLQLTLLHRGPAGDAADRAARRPRAQQAGVGGRVARRIVWNTLKVMHVLPTFAALLLFLPIGMAAGQEERSGDPVLGERLIEGIATATRLWVRGNEGAVVSFERGNGARRTLATTGVVDLLRDGGRTVALRKLSPGTYAVEDIETGEALAPVLKSEAAPLALIRSGGGWLVLTRDALVENKDGAWLSRPLSERLDQFGVPSIAASLSGVLYVGFNQGEWGGGLRSISTSTGVVREVRRVDDDPCDGPLAHECDPVTGIIQDRSQPECMLVSVGLMHMIAHGRILRVCGETVEVIHDEAIAPPVDREVIALPHTWPFFGLASTRDGWIAVSAGKLFRSTRGEIQQADLPTLEPWHGLEASFDDPAVIILKTDVNWGMSVSGYTPLLVPVSD